MKYNILKYSLLLNIVMTMGSGISVVSAAVDPFQLAIDDILRPPTVNRSTLADGSVVSTVVISGSYPTQAGTILSPDGRILRFTTESSLEANSNQYTPGYTTNNIPLKSVDYLDNSTRSLLQSSTSTLVDTFTQASIINQAYITTITDENNQSIIIPCIIANPCISASILRASNGNSFDLGSTTILPAISSVLAANTAIPIQSDSIWESRPPVLDTTPVGYTRIFTSEIVPGAKCQCITAPSTPNDDDGNKNVDIKWATGVACKGPVASRKYICEVPTGLAGFQWVFAQVIRFVINIVLLLGVLAVVGLGIAWSFAWGDDIKAKSILKTWAINIIIGLAILFFFRYILIFLAPWVYK